MKTKNKWVCVVALLLVTLVALGARLYAVKELPIDYDEDDYLGAGQRYLAAFRSGDWQAVVNYDFNYEHPPLTKLIYALVQLPVPDAPLIPEKDPSTPIAASLPQPQFTFARISSVVFGTLQAAALALIDPLAGLILALNNWQIKYTSQIMLEPLPALTSLLTVLCYTQSKRRRAGWLFASAVMLGITAASKYVYCIAGLAVLADWLAHTLVGINKKKWAEVARSLLPMAAWGGGALVVFYAFDPYLWVNPFERLWQSLAYHGSYATSQYVRNAGYPFWQPLVWLTSSPPWHPGAFWVSLELLYAVLAVLGFKNLWKTQRVQALWLMMALVFLLVWQTKWPQYILILTAPFSLAAAQGFRNGVYKPVAAWCRRQWANLRHPPQRQGRQYRSWKEMRKALPWLLPGLLGLLTITIFPLVFQFAMALTDYSSSSIFDGMQGGVWREVWLGLTGQVSPEQSILYGQDAVADKRVHFVGFRLLRDVFVNMGSSVLLFDFIWTVLSVGTQLALGLGVAYLLNKKGLLFKGWWSVVFILPWAIPEFVGVLIWSQVLDPHFGWAVTLTNLSHRPEYASAAWQHNPSLALFYLLAAGLWYGFPLIYVAASAGLKAVPEEVDAAAALDGAGGFQLFRYITFPLLLPLLAPVIILRMIYAFNQFYLFFMMRMEYPMLTLSVISFNIFNYSQSYAISAAINILTVILLFALILVFNHRSRAVEGVTYA